jgi:integrase
MAGHVEKRGPGRWLAVYYDADGKRRSKSYPRKLDADKFLATTTADQLRGDWIDPRSGRVTVREYGDEWLRNRLIRETTRERYIGYLRYVNLLGDVPMSALTPSRCEAWQQQLLAQLAPSTAGTIRGIFASMLKSAVRDRIIPRSPLDGIRAPRPVRVRVRPMPIETVQAIHDQMTPRYAAAVMLGAACGLRRGEAFGLTVDRVDFLRRTITVDRQLVQLAGQPPEFGPPKTAASVRDIPAPRFVIDELAAHLAAYPPGAGGLIFTTTLGGPVGRRTFSSAWHRAGAPDGSRFHDLRHFYASTLIAAGESVKVVQARLGHATAAETLETYAHLWPDDEGRTRDVLDAAFAPKPAVSDVRESHDR